MRKLLTLLVVVFVGTSSIGVGAQSNRRTRELTIPAGTLLRLQLSQPVGSDFSHVEDPVNARLVNPIVIDGRTVVPAGATAYGSVTNAVRSGRVKGRARLGMRFNTLRIPGDTARYDMRTSAWGRQAPGTKKTDAAKIAVPAAGGAVVGALVGGKKGAGVGALIGGGGGTGVVLATRGKEVRLGRGQIVAVRLTAPLTVRVPEAR